MATISGDTSDARRLASGLDKAAALLADLGAPNEEAGRVVLAAARPPRRSGELASRMFARADATNTVVASAAPHWSFVEFGAPRKPMRAQPFTRAALEESQAQVVGIYADHRDQALRLITT